MNILLTAFLISLVIQLVFFILAASFKTDKFTDLSYGATFIIMSLLLSKYTPVHILLMLMIVAWGLRLAIYLFIRILKIKKDDRFDQIRGDLLKFAGFWVLQAVSVWVIMLPSIVIFGKTNLEFALLNYIGIGVWAFGLAFETVADYQKFVFKNKNKNKFITSGLWRYSRHPNYFGEILVWWGVFLFAMPYLSGIEWLTIIGPLYIMFLLLFVSGIPPLEKKYDEKYGKDYEKYKKKTSVLVPFPPK